MIEFGRMVMVQQLITNASREGARLGVIDGTTTQEIIDRVADYLEEGQIAGQSVTVATLPPEGSDSGDRVAVTVSIPFSQVSWLPTPMFLSGTTLSSTTTMRQETF
jgi:Flp pilus assembly protein TadG